MDALNWPSYGRTWLPRGCHGHSHGSCPYQSIAQSIFRMFVHSLNGNPWEDLQFGTLCPCWLLRINSWRKEKGLSPKKTINLSFGFLTFIPLSYRIQFFWLLRTDWCACVSISIRAFRSGHKASNSVFLSHSASPWSSIPLLQLNAIYCVSQWKWC